MVSLSAMSTTSSFLKSLRGRPTLKLVLSLGSHPKLFHSPTSFRSLLHTLNPESYSDSRSTYRYDYGLAGAEYPMCAFFPYDNPLLKSGNKKLFEMKIDDGAAKLRMDMPGVSKEGLKVWFEKGVLKIKGFKAKAEEGLPKEEPRDGREQLSQSNLLNSHNYHDYCFGIQLI